MFLIIAFLIVLLMHYVTFAWTCLNTPFLSFGLKAKIAPAAAAVLFCGIFTAGHYFHNGFVNFLQTCAELWLGLLFLYFLVVLIFMALQLILKKLKLLPPFKIAPVAIVITALIAAIGTINALSAPQITEITIETPVEGVDGLKIVQLSDTHFGGTVTPSRARKLAKQVNALSPDLIVFTGDVFENIEPNEEKFFSALGEMKAKIGKFGVAGNHEYYKGVSKSMDLFRMAGIIPLQNSTLQAGKVNIIGLNDVLSSDLKLPYIETIIRKGTVSNKNFNLLLSHTPVFFDEISEKNVHLTLSGHTHNGQIWPFNYLVKLRFKNMNGLYEQNGHYLYVSSGTFYWGPALRLGTKNEIVLFTLKEKKNDKKTSAETQKKADAPLNYPGPKIVSKKEEFEEFRPKAPLPAPKITTIHEIANTPFPAAATAYEAPAENKASAPIKSAAPFAGNNTGASAKSFSIVPSNISALKKEESVKQETPKKISYPVLIDEQKPFSSIPTETPEAKETKAEPILKDWMPTLDAPAAKESEEKQEIDEGPKPTIFIEMHEENKKAPAPKTKKKSGPKASVVKSKFPEAESESRYYSEPSYNINNDKKVSPDAKVVFIDFPDADREPEDYLEPEIDEDEDYY